VRRGEVITSILQAVKDTNADLLAAGSHSQGVIDRLIIGSTTSQLLRAARCSVLVAPPDKSAASSTG
jgi:nucleotide-binding universal stress UspA family protein